MNSRKPDTDNDRHQGRKESDEIIVVESDVTSRMVDEVEPSNEHDLSGEAAGVVRGVSRSVVRAPWVGRLPKNVPRTLPRPVVPKAGIPKSVPKIPATPRPPVPKAGPSPSIGSNVLRQKVPVRQVARVTDRLSTGYDVYQSAVESSEQVSTPSNEKQTTASKVARSSWWSHLQSFSATLIRNTLLGMVVFESYGYLVASSVPPIESTSEAKVQDPNGVPSDATSSEHTLYVDDYARASLGVHFGAGSLAGCIHGIGTAVFEGNPFALTRFGGETASNSFSSTTKRFGRQLVASSLQHSVAHGMLFGSYEWIKRSGLSALGDTSDSYANEEHGNAAFNPKHKNPNSNTPPSTIPHLGTSYLAIYGVAGGLAGSIQHVVSHYAEVVFVDSGRPNWQNISRPALRPCLLAFPPSAIGFIAFEYGKHVMT